MRKYVLILSFSILLLSTGCGKTQTETKSQAETEVETETANQSKVQEVISIYESYRNGDISETDAMTQMIAVAAEINDESIAALVRSTATCIANENLDGTSNTEKRIQELREYVDDSSEYKAAKSEEERLYDDLGFLSDSYNLLRDLDSYIDDGTNSVGGEFDAELAIDEFLDIYTQRDECLNHIESLSDADYSVLKSAYSKAVAEIDNYYKLLSENKEYIISSKGTNQRLDLSLLYQYEETVRKYIVEGK
jgi:hypothetical protein